MMRLVYDRLGNGDATRGRKHQFHNFDIYSCIRQHDFLVLRYKNVGLGVELVATTSRLSSYIPDTDFHGRFRGCGGMQALAQFAGAKQFPMSSCYQIMEVAHQLQLPSIANWSLVDEFQNVAISVVRRYECPVGSHVDDGFWRDVQVLRHFAPPQVVAHLGSVSCRTCTLPRTIDIPCSRSLESLSSRSKQNPSTSADRYCGPSSAIVAARNSFDGRGSATLVPVVSIRVVWSFCAITLCRQPTPPRLRCL